MARGATAAPQTYPDTTSGYGPTRADSVGVNPRNILAYSATQAAKAYYTQDQGDVSTKAKGYING